ncbi:MAG: hydantoinase/oxoprolinase family protein [Nocardioidaceae bacterium]
MTDRRYRVGIDTGGTFTDVVVVDEATGEIATTKTATTPSDPSVGFMAGLTKALAALGVGPDALASVSHGTTVATNRLLTGLVDSLGFVTTEGYEHILEIARQSVPDGYGNSYFWVKPPRIVPADLVFGVGGRLAFDGKEIRPFDEASAVAAAERLKAAGVRAVGVCFLHSYADPSHEEAMRDVLARVHPDAVVSISSEVLREYREYERSVTTLVDAAVKPSIRDYVASISAKLEAYVSTGRRTDAAVPFSVMKSNGGVLSAAEVVRQPITTVLSGPAAGALGAAVVAAAAGCHSVVTCDGGGTSTDVALVVDGRPTLTTEGTIGAYPSKIPMIDVVAVGAGGGSIAQLSPEGTLKVGPESAGADPGPMCYAAGGDRPTVTDAHAVLGRIPPHLLGGEVPLDLELARRGIERIASDLGLGAERAAAGILEISAWNQANAVRQITVQRGLDVRDFHLVTFGGSGSLLVCRLLDILGAPGALVPRNPGNLSAYGLLTVDARVEQVQTAVARHAQQRPSAVTGVIEGLRERARDALRREGFDDAEQVFEVTADLRYFGQAYEVRVPVPEGELTSSGLEEVASAFHDEHRTLYGYDLRQATGQEVEWVTLRVSGIGPIRRPAMSTLAPGRGVAAATSGSRPVFFDDWAEALLVDRARLGCGDLVEGPAVVEESSSTLPLHPGFQARVDTFGNLVVSRQRDSGGSS